MTSVRAGGVMVGASCWALTALYFPAEMVVTAAAWPQGYDAIAQTISDLGATRCGQIVQFGGDPVAVCSPWHSLMNAAFVMTGALTLLGAVLTRPAWPRRRLVDAALGCVALAGLGGLLVGLAPLDVNLAVHGVGALLQVPGAVAPILVGLAVGRRSSLLAGSSYALGVLGAVATCLFVAQVWVQGPGLTERLAIWPLSAWTTIAGSVLLLGGASHPGSITGGLRDSGRPGVTAP